MDSIQNNKVTKVEIITGFLGVGKTTFIKKLIENNIFKDEKILIIENEFGDIPVDDKVLADDAYDLIELSGGCICCSVKSNLIDTLIQLARREKPDRIIIEPSGVFVAEELKQIMKIEEIAEHYRVSGIYTIIDPVHFSMDKMREAPFYKSQLKFANHVFIKGEKIQTTTYESLYSKVRQVNPQAQCHMKPIQDMTVEDLETVFRDKEVEPFYDISVLHHPHQHATLTSTSIENVPTLTEAVYESFKKKLIQGAFGDILRLKGFLSIEGTSYLLNYTQGEFTLEKQRADQFFLTAIGYDIKNLIFLNAFNDN